MTLGRFILIVLNVFLSLILITVAWECCSIVLGAERFPDLAQTTKVLINSFSHDSIIAAQGGGTNGYCPHVKATCLNFIVGFFSGASVGILVAILLFQWTPLLEAIDPLIEFFRVMPPLIVIPFAVLCFRSTDILPAVTVALYSAFTIVIYVLNALRNIPTNYLILAKFLGASRIRRIIDVQLPAIVPGLLGALRVACIFGLGISVVAEYMAAPAGIGRVMKFAISFSRIDLIFVGVVWVVLIALLVELTLSLILKPLLAWTERSKLADLV